MVLLLAIGVLLMHGTASSPTKQAIPAVASMARIVHFQQHEAAAALQHTRASRSPSPSMPTGCSGGAVCRAVTPRSTAHLLPAVAAVSPDKPAAPDQARPTVICHVALVAPPPTRSLLQVWRC
jgi:hypothetical protein